MGDMEVGDCSTDGTCEDATGNYKKNSRFYDVNLLLFHSGPGGAGIPLEGVKLSNTTLLEETALAFQQFSIGKFY